MDDKKIFNLAKRYAEVVLNNNFDVDKIMLYGSYARGIATDDSDIDIAVIVDSSREPS